MKPKHVAIIMDGNGRWASERRKPRSFGHAAGANQAKIILEHAVRLKVPTLTLWGFSTENRRRPENEVNALMGLFESFAIREASKLDKANIRVTFIGRRTDLPDSLQRIMRQVEERTAKNTGLHLRPAINFSATQEFVDAAGRLIAAGKTVTDESIRQEIWGDTPPYDLVIRTGKECRTSDFPVGHAELFFCPVLWPGFLPSDLDRAIAAYQARDRRLGGVSAVIK